MYIYIYIYIYIIYIGYKELQNSSLSNIYIIVNIKVNNIF